MTGRDDRRAIDPLDLESLPGQARHVPDDDEETEGPETAQEGPSADSEGRGKDDSEKLDQYLLRRYHLYGDRKAREQLITMYLPLVRSLARRYASRGEHFDDLVQVGAIGLIKAIDRFDLSRGVEADHSYATPNIVGEIKRYFRDKGWSVRVPRRGLQELDIRLNKVIDELVPKLQRSPTVDELAEAASATPEEVLEALETSQAYNSVSLQASPNGEGGEEDAGLIDYLGGEEEAYDTMEDRTTLAPGFAKLDKRERYILHLRFFEGTDAVVRSRSAWASPRCTSRASSGARWRSCGRRSAISTARCLRVRPTTSASSYRHPRHKDSHVNAADIRDLYRDFFVSHGHLAGEPASLAAGDTSVLFTTAGMQQYKPYFLGVETPPATRITTCQRSFRTSDVENVGKTARHLTFFEMLGNFSFGDYFKAEAIDWALELSDQLGIDRRKVWVSVYGGDSQVPADEEAVALWKSHGFTDDRIVRLGRSDNFWGPAGPTGPCGPCSELYYDFGPEMGCDDPDCKPGCDCDRYLEYWNLVFVQYDMDEAGTSRRCPRAASIRVAIGVHEPFPPGATLTDAVLSTT